MANAWQKCAAPASGWPWMMRMRLIMDRMLRSNGWRAVELAQARVGRTPPSGSLPLAYAVPNPPEPSMSDTSILHHISALVDEERRLRADSVPKADHSARLKQVAEELDQCWDLLRQRRAKREFGDNPAEASVRDVGTVERYQG